MCQEVVCAPSLHFRVLTWLLVSFTQKDMRPRMRLFQKVLWSCDWTTNQWQAQACQISECCVSSIMSLYMKSGSKHTASSLFLFLLFVSMSLCVSLSFYFIFRDTELVSDNKNNCIFSSSKLILLLFFQKGIYTTFKAIWKTAGKVFLHYENHAAARKAVIENNFFIALHSKF